MLKRHFLASLVLVFLILAIIASSVTIAYGHGFGTDKSFPMTVGNKQVVVEATMNPGFIDQISSSVHPTLRVRALDSSSPNSNTTIDSVDFRIAVELKGKMLLDQRFRSSDGIVLANLVPDNDISGWEINGKAPQEQVAVSQGSPVELRSKIFSAGGLYHVAVTIETSSSGIAVPSNQKFDLYVSVGNTYNFDVDTPQGKEQMVVKTYYDEVNNFDYSNNTISFSMPFMWDAAFIAQVPLVHLEVQFPKSIKALQVNSYKGTMNGKDLEATAVVIDDYTSENNRTVHFIISNAMLGRVADSIKGNSDTATFTLTPAEKPKFPMDITSLPKGKYVFEMSWGPDLIQTGTPTTFVMNIQDPTTGDLIRNSAYDFVLVQDGKEIFRSHRPLDFGTDSLKYTFTKAGMVTLSANNISGQGESAKIDLVVLQGSGNSTAAQPQQQPSGCLIATAAFGSELTPQVQFLRNFRDHYILSTVSGSAFMNTFNTIYYSFSPQVADYERGQPWLQSTVKVALYPLFGILLTAQESYSAIDGEAGTILAGATAGSLIGAVYLWPAGLVASRVSSKWLAIAAGAALAVLAITLVALPALLPLSTSVFVVAVAGASAIAMAKAVRHIIRWRMETGFRI